MHRTPESHTITGRIAFWAAAAEKLRDRVMDPSATQFEHELDATLLAIAIRNVLRAVDWAAELEPSIATAVADFDSKVPNAKHTRDVIDHFDEYDRGVGKLQKKNLLRGYAIWTVRYEDQYLLHLADGFELDVQSSVIAVGQLANAAQVALHGRSERPLDY